MSQLSAINGLSGGNSSQPDLQYGQVTSGNPQQVAAGNGNANNSGNNNSQAGVQNTQNGQNSVNGNYTAEGGKTQNSSQQASSAQNSSTEKQKALSQQIQSEISPTPMLSQAMMYQWDYKDGGAVVNVIDFKTGKVVQQIPPENVLKVMSNYQKGSLYNQKM